MQSRHLLRTDKLFMQAFQYARSSVRSSFAQQLKAKLPVFYSGICYTEDGELEQEKATALLDSKGMQSAPYLSSNAG